MPASSQAKADNGISVAARARRCRCYVSAVTAIVTRTASGIGWLPSLPPSLNPRLAPLLFSLSLHLYRCLPRHCAHAFMYVARSRALKFVVPPGLFQAFAHPIHSCFSETRIPQIIPDARRGATRSRSKIERECVAICFVVGRVASRSFFMLKTCL